MIFPEDYEKWFDRFHSFLLEFLKHCPENHKKNYVVNDWEKSESSFLKNTFIDHRYDSGAISVVLKDDALVALSACHDFKDGLAYLGSRSCALPDFERYHLISSILIPKQQSFLKDRFQFGFVTFNTDSYSKRLMAAFAVRDKWTRNKASRMGGLEYFNFKFIDDKTFTIHGCQQYVAYCSFSQITSEEEFLLRLQ